MDRLQKVTFVAVAVLAALLYSAPSASADPMPFTVHFSVAPGANINFNGSGSFSFTNNGSGFSFYTTQQQGFADDGGAEAAVGLTGTIGGVFTIGSCSGCSQTTVSGSGPFAIKDDDGYLFSANVTWVNIANQGTGDTLNVGGQLNLTNISYDPLGTNANLRAMSDMAMLNSQLGVVSVSFQFVPSRTIEQLMTMSGGTSYSGSMAVPEPASLMLLGVAFLGLGVTARRRIDR